MGERHVMSALKARRDDLERVIEHGRRALAQWERELEAVEAALAVMAQGRPAKLAFYVVPPQFKRMRTTRLVLAIVRENGPMSVREIARALIRQHAADDTDAALIRAIERKVWAVVKKQGLSV